MISLVLASASPSRLRILQQAGVDPVVCPSRVDEDALADALPEDTGPVRMVEELARAKAKDVFEREGHRLIAEAQTAESTRMVIVGCDSMLSVNNKLEGKPHTYDRALQRWQSVRGRHGVLLTGHAMLVVDCATGSIVHEDSATSDTTVHFGNPSDCDLDAYLRTGEPLECAGAFTLESLGGWFIDRIDGDPSSVIGISLPLLRRLLDNAGIGVRELWQPGLA